MKLATIQAHRLLTCWLRIDTNETYPPFSMSKIARTNRKYQGKYLITRIVLRLPTLYCCLQRNLYDLKDIVL